MRMVGALIAAMALIACGDDAGDGDDDDGTGTDTGSGTGTNTSTGTSTGTGSSTGTGTAVCSDEQTLADCQFCCAQQNQDAVAESNEIIASTCLCGVGAVCEAQCAADCPDLDPPSVGCTSCMQGADGAACLEEADAACLRSATCAPFAECRASCG